MMAKDVDGWDSLAHMALIVEIENAFQIKFKLKDLNKMKNVGSMIDIIMAKL
jgi:acyl carrier protein